VATVVSQTVLATLVATGAATPVWANVAATAAGTVPSFELNRRWVWGKQGRRSLHGEVLPFVFLTFLGLALSTISVHFAAAWADDHVATTTVRTLVVQVANLSAFGVVWVLQFVILDRILFGSRPARDEAGSDQDGREPVTVAA
jgi:putative flippase GtrA